MASNSLLQLSRKVHLYLGLLISPALLFFAFTGAFQTLSLHEAASDYKPPALLARLGQIHKKQTTTMQQRRAAPAGGDRPDATRPPALQGGAAAGSGHVTSGGTDTGRPGSGGVSERPAPGKPPQPPQTLSMKEHQHLPLKLFFLLVSLGLFTNTLTGVYMAYRYDRNKVLVSALLIAGVVLPLVLLRF